MTSNSQCYVEWKEEFVSKERGKRLVHYFLKDISGESVLAVVGTERSVRHMLYVVSEEFLKVNEARNSVNAGYRWRSRREVVNWLTSMLSKQHRNGENSRSPKNDHVAGVGASYQNHLAGNLKIRALDIVWAGVAWTCGKQLKHFPAFCRNGITIAVQSFVFVMAEEEKHHLAYLEDMYEDRKGQKKVKVRWFHHNQEVQSVVTLKSPHPKEVFITPYSQVISVECVDGPAIVLAREHYDKCVSNLPEDLLARLHLCVRQFKNNRVKPFKLSKLCGYFEQLIFSVMGTEFFEDEDNDDNVKVGRKRPRSARGRHVARCDSLGLDLKYEMLRRKLIPKYVKNNRDYLSLISGLKVNEKYESLCQDSGIRGCWFRCTVLQINKRKIKVKYDDLKEEGGNGNLEEWVPACIPALPDKLGVRCSGRPTVRPARLEIETNVNFEVGSAVDAWWNDGWWEGVVTGIDDSSDVQVYVPGESLFLELHRKKIRVSKDWVGDRWVDLETKPDILSITPTPNEKNVKPKSFPVSSKETQRARSSPSPACVEIDKKDPNSARVEIDKKDPNSARVEIGEKGDLASDYEEAVELRTENLKN